MTPEQAQQIAECRLLMDLGWRRDALIAHGYALFAIEAAERAAGKPK